MHTIIFLFISTFQSLLVTVTARSLAAAKQDASIPLHQIVICLGAVGLLLIGTFIYFKNREEEIGVEFNEFNSQYLGKESTRSNTDFPNFGVDILKESKTEDSFDYSKSIEKRRRRRKFGKN